MAPTSCCQTRRLSSVSNLAKPRRIHLASRCYIRGFAVNGRVFVDAAQAGKPGEVQERTVSSVAWRPGWWGSSSELAEAAEFLLGRSEDETAPILRELTNRWPLSREDRAALAQFIAIHAVRTPAWRNAYDTVTTLAIHDELDRRRWDPEVEKQAVAELISDRMRVESLLKQIPRMASLFMSMHWSLVQFNDPLLASCDQPVVCVPILEPWQRRPIQAMPRLALWTRPRSGSRSIHGMR
jgi:hypothetical protein